MPRRIRCLNSAELSVLEIVLRETSSVHQLPVFRFTDADGPNQWRLDRWALPSTLECIGEVRVVDDEAEDAIRFRRPRLDGESAEVTLELPQQVFHYELEHSLSRGWRLRVRAPERLTPLPE